MGSNADVYKAYNKASYANPPESMVEAAMKYLSEDFQGFDGAGNVVTDKAGQVGMTQLLTKAFTDFKTIVTDVREEGDSVIVSYHFEGKHTSDLDMTAMGMGVVPASGKKIVWPDSMTEFKIKGNQIASTRPYGETGGIESFFEPLGVKLPSA